MSIYAGLTVMLPNDGVRFAASQRLNLMLTDGSKIELFGDVLTPGKDAELAAAIQVAIDAMGTRDMRPRHLLWGAGLLEPFRSVFVRWDALRPTLAPSGRATSAWTEIPVP